MLYRAYISEVVAIINGGEKAREINIVDDRVWAVYVTTTKPNIDNVFEITGKINSLMAVFNYKLKKAWLHQGEIKVGIGASYGRALMIKAGFSGSGINDAVYMGDVVNHAAKLAAKGNKDWANPIFISNLMHKNLKEKYADYCTKDYVNDCYKADANNSLMNEWYEQNCT